MGYGIIGLLSIIVRNFALPNPFEVLGDGTKVYGIFLTPAVLNLVAEPILHLVTFTEVGLFYHSGEMPGLGSLLYLVFYVLNVGILQIASRLGFHWYTNLLVFGLYITGLVWFLRSNDA